MLKTQKIPAEPSGMEGEETFITFISDLHLKPDRPDLVQRFDTFLKWAETYVHTLYILGDFFHVWSGDDCADAFSLSIADKLRQLSKKGTKVYFIAGNRDFLLRNTFANRAGMTILQEPYRLDLGAAACLLTHGDRYCLNDKRHQWFRRITRSRWFAPLFLRLPAIWRQRLAGNIRRRSRAYQKHHEVNTDVDAKALIAEMNQYDVHIAIHGHTHKSGITQYQAHLSGKSSSIQSETIAFHSEINKTTDNNRLIYTRFVLSDWDDKPKFMCYHKSMGFKFVHLSEV